MKLGEKIRYLREVEGSLRGLGRPMTQQEIVLALRQELGRGRGLTKMGRRKLGQLKKPSASPTCHRSKAGRGRI